MMNPVSLLLPSPAIFPIVKHHHRSAAIMVCRPTPSPSKKLKFKPNIPKTLSPVTLLGSPSVLFTAAPTISASSSSSSSPWLKAVHVPPPSTTTRVKVTDKKLRTVGVKGIPPWIYCGSVMEYFSTELGYLLESCKCDAKHGDGTWIIELQNFRGGK